MSGAEKSATQGARPAEEQGAPRRRPGIFAIITLVAAVVAMSLIVWRITKAWRLEYGSGPRDPRPIPTTGAFGAPGALPTPMRTAAPATTSSP